MPKTLVGKVAYRVLEDEEKAKLAAQSGEAQPEAQSAEAQPDTPAEEE